MVEMLHAALLSDTSMVLVSMMSRKAHVPGATA